MFYALIGDIKKSRKSSDRFEMQEKLSRALDSVNKRYADAGLASKMVITIGDEFQGLFGKSEKIFEIIYKIEKAMYPEKLRFSIGCGEILTKVNESALASDGPAWWRAREGIKLLHDKYERGLKTASNIRVVSFERDDKIDTVNVILSLTSWIKDRWTKDQKKTADSVVEYYGLTSKFVQKEIADKIGINPDVMNKRLKNANYLNYVLAIEKITNLMDGEFYDK